MAVPLMCGIVFVGRDLAILHWICEVVLQCDGSLCAMNLSLFKDLGNYDSIIVLKGLLVMSLSNTSRSPQYWASVRSHALNSFVR